MENKKIKAIIFDIGGVLFENKKGGFETLAEIFGVQLSKISNIIIELQADIYRGKIDSREVLSIIKQKLQSEISIEDAYTRWEEIFESGIAPINHELFSIIEKLGEQYKLYVFSNTIDVHVKATNHAISKANFEKIFRSFEEKIAKPEPESFSYISQKIGIKPEECIFIDDLAENISGAIKSGMQGIVFKNNEQLTSDLIKIGISI